MPTSTPTLVSSSNFVTRLLASNDKKTAAVIDDAFDKITENEIEVEDILALQIDRDADLQLLLDKLGITRPSDSQIEDDEEVRANYLNELWNARTSEPKLFEPISELFHARLQKDHDLTLICENLEKLGVKVWRFSSDVTQDQLTTGEDRYFDFVFIDYFLGPDGDAGAVRNAERKIQEIHTRCPTPNKPITVLMSSNDDVIKYKEQFRQNAKLVEGVFRFSAKSALKDAHLISLVVVALINEFTERHEIQDYVNALCLSADNALQRFKNDVRSLNIEDYVFIQHLGLNTDEQPLGDYVTWLYGSYWEQLLLRDASVVEHQEKLNSLFNSKFPILHGQLSPKIADIYMNALFEEPGDITNNVRQLAKAKAVLNRPENNLATYELMTATMDSSLNLNLGDIFIKSATEPVWMVINAQCDLARAYLTPDQSIVLVPGNLIAWESPISNKSIRTEFFRLNNHSYRIVWDLKKVETRPFNKIWKWKQKQEYKRHYRLKLPFALEVQRSFTAKLGRIGLPVPPPIAESIEIEVYAAPNGSIPVQIIPPNSTYLSRVGWRSDDNPAESKMVFTLPFVYSLGKILPELMRTPDFSATLTKGDKYTFKHPLIALVDNLSEWFHGLATMPHNFPNPGELSDLGRNVQMATNWEDASKINWEKKSLLINIITK